MLRLLVPSLLLVLAACAGGSTIEGSLLDAEEAAQVSIGDAEPVDMEAGAFRLDGVSGDTIALSFDGGDRDASTMRIVGLPGGSRLTLHGIWFEDDLAFPNSIGIDGREPLSINGIRYANLESVQGEMTAAGTVLALSREDATLLMRPFDAGLPDLRVMLGAGAILESVDGETVEFGRLRFGDTISVQGIAQSGYLLATQIGMPTPIGGESSRGSDSDAREAEAREVAAGEARELEREREAEARDDDRDEGRGNRARAGVGRGRGGGRR